ncbi:MAG: Transcription termination factor [Phormidesmis priestleyi Ana]|uniref:Transcription termination factor n=1 Tax=Phormidesmis priestleyi Ana TaxID=1666911 RepID=A0A0P7ZRZ3_9CYAN|nr:MAG: Transcription termination factor [Phormidesmis priestleyi Ana]
MGLRLKKKIKLFPGLSLNLSKSGISASIKAGPVSWNSRSQKTSVNLPGPLSYQSNSSKAKGATKADLVNIARQAGLSGYSKLKKQELAALLKQHSLL